MPPSVGASHIMGTMHDSIFSPILAAGEFIPPDVVDRIDTATDIGTADLVALLDDAADAVIPQLLTALDNGDVAAINSATWGLGLQMQPILFGVWQGAFDSGAVDGLGEVIEAVEAEVGPRVRALGAVILRAQLDADTLAAIEEVYNTPAPQLINTDAVQAVIARVSQISGDFAADTLASLKQAVIAAIVPQADTGEPITRAQLLERIESVLGVGRNRATAIARTEINYAYNRGRVAAFNRVTLVDYVRVIVIQDNRLTDICRSRAGVVVPKENLSLIGGAPPYHVQCRTMLGAVMSKLPRFQEMVADPGLRPENRDLVPLPPGWA